MHIAICGELGAGCTEVGQRISKETGMKCISSAEIIKGIVLNFRGIHPDETYLEFEKHVQSGEVNLDRMIDGKLDETLEEGDFVVEGRSAFMLLDNKGIFKVLLVASHNKRVEHISKRRNITVKEAEESIHESDAERRHMVEKLFKKQWLNPHNYDIVINTDSKSYEDTAALIIRIFS